MAPDGQVQLLEVHRAELDVGRQRFVKVTDRLQNRGMDWQEHRVMACEEDNGDSSGSRSDVVQDFCSALRRGDYEAGVGKEIMYPVPVLSSMEK